MKKLIGIVFCMLLSTVSPIIPAEVAENQPVTETQVEILGNDLVKAHEVFDPNLLHSDRSGPGYYDTSEFLIGSIAIGVIFLESNGLIDPNLENWTPTEISSTRSEINQTIAWWAAQNQYAGVSFTLDVHTNVQISYEPIIHPSVFTNGSWEKLWVSEAMATLGYTSGDWMQRTRDYINAIRLTAGTDWAYAVYLIDSSADSDGCFSDGYSAYAYLGGPFAVMTYDNGGWGISAMDQVFAHETGHIFWATDEYNGITEWSGYLNAADVEGSSCLMDTNTLVLSSGTQLQVGWRDTDGDTILDILDTFPQTTIVPYTPDPTTTPTLTYVGDAYDVALTNQNPSPYDPGNDLTINHIILVMYRVDGGTFIPAIPTDGAWDEWTETYTFTTIILPPGTHLIEVISMNSVSNMDQTPASDIVTIDTPPNNPTIAGPTNGKIGDEISYTFLTIDPDGDPVQFLIDWGDGQTSGWLGPVPSGIHLTANHTWTVKGSYTVKAKAKDSKGIESGWGTLQITLPFSSPTAHWLFDFLTRHPLLKAFIVYLLQGRVNQQ